MPLVQGVEGCRAVCVDVHLPTTMGERKPPRLVEMFHRPEEQEECIPADKHYAQPSKLQPRAMVTAGFLHQRTIPCQITGGVLELC